MRLLNTKTLNLEYFADSRTRPLYAILSHTWGEDEVSFQEIVSCDEDTEHKKGFAKIRFACAQALSDGFQYAWVDTCCKQHLE